MESRTSPQAAKAQERTQHQYSKGVTEDSRATILLLTNDGRALLSYSVRHGASDRRPAYRLHRRLGALQRVPRTPLDRAPGRGLDGCGRRPARNGAAPLPAGASAAGLTQASRGGPRYESSYWVWRLLDSSCFCARAPPSLRSSVLACGSSSHRALHFRVEQYVDSRAGVDAAPGRKDLARDRPQDVFAVAAPGLHR